MSTKPTYSVSDFVAVFNQVVDVAFGSVTISGELAQFRISKNRWVYFDLIDEYASVRFFGTVNSLPGPLEDGMTLVVHGIPQLHPRFGFSITVQSIQLKGEGTIKKASALLEAQLEKEGLFAAERKRLLPYPPQTIGLITSSESAAYADFVKIINARWGGVEIGLYDVHVQGEQAPSQIIEAINYFNAHATPPDVLVITRGGGSAEDLQAFNTEGVTRAIAASRIPTLVAIGHEVDLSLAERAADKRASTPSNAAEMLTPDKQHQRALLEQASRQILYYTEQTLHAEKQSIKQILERLDQATQHTLQSLRQELDIAHNTITLLNPLEVLKRGYVMVRQGSSFVVRAQQLNTKAELSLRFYDKEVTIKPTSGD